MHRHTKVAALTTALTLAGSSVANATLADHFHFHDSGPGISEDLCGLTVQHSYVVEGNWTIRAGTGDLAGAFFGGTVYRYVDTFQNPANGRTITISGTENYRDVKATHVSGTIFQFVTQESGQPFVLKADDGTVAFRDRGVIKTTYLFDSGGDNVPGGTTLQTLSVTVHGPHPGLDAPEDEFCTAALAGLT